jgi:hypothetical protein
MSFTQTKRRPTLNVEAYAVSSSSRLSVTIKAQCIVMVCLYLVSEPDSQSKEIQQRYLQVVITTPTCMDVLLKIGSKALLQHYPARAVWHDAHIAHASIPLTNLSRLKDSHISFHFETFLLLGLENADKVVNLTSDILCVDTRSRDRILIKEHGTDICMQTPKRCQVNVRWICMRI